MMLGPLILDLHGPSLDAEEKELLRHPLVGGVILFQRNYVEKFQLIDLIRAIRFTRSELLIAVDQEGGRVQRFIPEFTRLDAFSSLGKLYDENQQQAILKLQQHAAIMATELLAVGIDFSFTPVVDLNKGVSDVIGSRSFHREPNIVSLLASHYISVMKQKGMASVAKHFPGHGSVAPDTHHAIAVDDRDYDKIVAQDMQPFISLIKAGVNAVMPAHIIFPAVDDFPVGFSAKWLKTILRQQYRFEGAIISDDLSMKGASTMGDIISRTELSLTAGCDLVLICNDRKAAITVLDNLRYPVEKSVQSRLTQLSAKRKE